MNHNLSKNYFTNRKSIVISTNFNIIKINIGGACQPHTLTKKWNKNWSWIHSFHSFILRPIVYLIFLYHIIYVVILYHNLDQKSNVNKIWIFNRNIKSVEKNQKSLVVEWVEGVVVVKVRCGCVGSTPPRFSVNFWKLVRYYAPFALIH